MSTILNGLIQTIIVVAPVMAMLVPGIDFKIRLPFSCRGRIALLLLGNGKLLELIDLGH